MNLRTGRTGGIASGKTTIARLFAALGCVTIDADQIVAHLYQPGEAGHEALVRTYGTGISLEDGMVDRRKLAGIATASEEAASAPTARLQPLVAAEAVDLMA